MQNPAPLKLLTSENMIQFPLWFVNHASNFVWSISAAAASIFAVNYYSEILLDQQIQGATDWTDIAFGLAGGIVGIRLHN